MSLTQTARFYWRLAAESIDNRLSKEYEIFYIMEHADWVIKRIGDYLHDDIPQKFRRTISSHGIRNAVIHYGAPYALWNKNRVCLPHKSNKIVVTWFHVVNNDDRCALLPRVKKHVDLWHTASHITKNKLQALGISSEKIVLIPLGVDLEVFYPCDQTQKQQIRRELGLPGNKIIIGSFQKDGVGWGEGEEPKLIKGPDVFCDVVEKLSRRYEIAVLLTGPARGYVKTRLQKAGVPFYHSYLRDYEDVAKYYRALDFYLVASREEGGPLAVLESLACGIPLVSTKVGLAPDVIAHGNNGFLTEVEDVKALFEGLAELIENKVRKEDFIQKGVETVKEYSWRRIVRLYQEKIYQVLL